MSAAANAAGYLCTHGLLPLASVQAQIDADTSRRRPQKVPSLPARRPSPLATQPRTPRIEYRKRRVVPVPA